MDYLAALPVLLFLLGLIVGSFLNVVICRVPRGEGIGGRSWCPACTGTLRWFELIPVFSYIVQRGRCRRCVASISMQYPLVEFATGIIFAALSLRFAGTPWLLIGFAILFSFLIALFVIDLRFGVLPDALTLPAIGVAVIVFLATFYQVPSTNYQLLLQWLAAIAIGVGFFALQWLISRGRWIGSGDIRLGALMGAILESPWPLLLALVVAYVVGAVVGIVLLMTKQVTRKSAIPFGPFLILGTFVAFFWGGLIIDWYTALVVF